MDNAKDFFNFYLDAHEKWCTKANYFYVCCVLNRETQEILCKGREGAVSRPKAAINHFKRCAADWKWAETDEMEVVIFNKEGNIIFEGVL